VEARDRFLDAPDATRAGRVDDERTVVADHAAHLREVAHIARRVVAEHGLGPHAPAGLDDG
jgi:hypothetical protein